ncbi:MAG TPA: hypothetical protein VN541_17125 [Tepidisphaeraceae bacterium]|nr:hypothetical protein [Tepidisphaeraceae bacterium]
MSIACLLSGCPDARSGDAGGSHTGTAHPHDATLSAINLSDPIRPVPGQSAIHLAAAANEWTSFTLEARGVFAARPNFVRFTYPQTSAANPIDPANLATYQILPMPVDVNPGYVRHTGLNTANRSIPRALLPEPLANGMLSLSAFRDPTAPTNSRMHPNGGSVLIWVDLHVPANTPPGTYTANCELTDAQNHVIGATVPVELRVYDFSLPDERHLQMVGQLGWNRLGALYPQWFGDTITPSLINRREPRYAKTVQTLDQMMILSQANRAALVAPGLKPTVKWPAGAPPEIDWRELDALIAPWLSGEAFADHVPFRYWPLPAAQSLNQYDPKSRLDYWSAAAAHFDQLGWLANSAVPLSLKPRGIPTQTQARDLAAEAAQILAANPNVRVTLPLEDDQLGESGPIQPADRHRVLTAAAGLISTARPPGILAQDRARQHWLRTDLPGLVPYDGAGGDERDVRLWAWLAFLRQADLILWDHVLPATNVPEKPADANAMTWFYPGEWFGIDQPVATIQLKWLRRAQQDYEYLWLARERGEVINALQMARLITKPVEILPGQAADPAYSLMSGTSSPEAWDRAMELLARTILLRKPGTRVDENQQRALYIQTLQWAEPQERPLLMPRSTAWSMQGPRKDGFGPPRGNWINLKFALDIYNASDTTPDHNQLRWEPPPPESGWEVHPEQPVEVARLQTYHVQPATLSARFDLEKLSPDARSPVGADFIDGYSNKAVSRLSVRLPVAASDRREGPLALDGNLDDWSDADAFQNGPLVLMMNRPDLQKQQLRSASVNARVYSGWGRDNFYLAFALEGLSVDEHQAHNDVYYQARRAWGEDLCEALIQPVYSDNTLGPVLHVVFKPNGALWVEHKLASAGETDDWRPIEGAGVRYATTTGEGRWHGEAGIPWKLICGSDREIPTLLRFNFSQHRAATCESASWCGPVDFGRYDRLMGVLYVRTPRDLGIVNTDDN